ncbi:MAG: hypothetical protein PHI38_05440 [Sulfurimonas sp.]|jgi:hypothetical protein|uniref:hypothetical protein n=1 Tax=Sulfurimonas sp. TaxID=2022749 RepID=UPI00260AA174|nr:hypothetical protein [Sulfurimonas sp.]MDD3476292.1 hypothetical protein [Sulfurimonas sp.]
MQNSKQLNLTELEESFVFYTKFSLEETQKLCRWFRKQNTFVQIEIFKEQRNQFFKYIELIDIKEIVPLVAFYMAIKNFYNLENQQNLKNKSMQLKNIEKSSNLSIKQFRKSKVKVKRDKLLNLWSVIERLRTEGFSFREISIYLKSKHRFSVSHTYISSVWKELEHGN